MSERAHVTVGYSATCLGLTAWNRSLARVVDSRERFAALQSSPLRPLLSTAVTGDPHRFRWVEEPWTHMTFDASGGPAFVDQNRLDRYLFGSSAVACQRWLDDQMVHGATIVCHHLSEAERLSERYGVNKVLVELHAGIIGHDDEQLLLNWADDPLRRDRMRQALDGLIEWGIQRQVDYGMTHGPFVVDTAHVQQYNAGAYTNEKFRGRASLFARLDVLERLMEHNLIAPVVQVQCCRDGSELSRLLADYPMESMCLVVRLIGWFALRSTHVCLVSENTPKHFGGYKQAVRHGGRALLSAGGAARFQQQVCAAIAAYLRTFEIEVTATEP